jgi:multidrug efflux pump
MMVVKLEEGWDRLRAATYAYTSTAFPMLTGTLVTAAGFMPVGFAKSIAGQYAGGIFWVVGTALILSWLVAVIFTPYLGVLLLPKNLATRNGHGAHHDPYDRPVYRRLRGIVDWAVHRRAWVLAATVLVFAMSGAGMLAVQQQFFPTASRPELLVDWRRTRTSSSSPPTPVAARRASTCRSSRNCPIRVSPSSSSRLRAPNSANACATG